MPTTANGIRTGLGKGNHWCALVGNQRETTVKLGSNSLEDIKLSTSGGALLGKIELMLMKRYVGAVDLPALI